MLNKSEKEEKAGWVAFFPHVVTDSAGAVH